MGWKRRDCGGQLKIDFSKTNIPGVDDANYGVGENRGFSNPGYSKMKTKLLPPTPAKSSDISKSLADTPVTSAKVLRRFRVVFNAVRTHFRQMEKQVGLGGAQVWALSIIANSPGIGMGSIAAEMDIHQSTTSNLVKELQRKKLISVAKAIEDRRNAQIHALPAGLKLLESVEGPFAGVLPKALDQLSGTVLQRLDMDLGALIEILNADEAAAEIPLANI